jgi:hypothetical protein
MKTLTPSDIRTVIGNTWFDFQDEQDTSIHLDTRQNGSVYDEAPGQLDITEGLRILAAIRAVYPPTDYASAFETVDEWVCVNIHKEPHPPEKRLLLLAQKAAIPILNAYAGGVTYVNGTFPKGVSSPFYFHPDSERLTWKLTVKFGELLHDGRNHPPFAFATQEAAETAAIKLVAEWGTHTKTIQTPKEHTTFSGKALHRSGSVTYEGNLRHRGIPTP